MTRAERAKQFLPFSGLAGLEKALAKQEFIPTERIELGEDALAELDCTMRQLQPGDKVKAVYYHNEQYNEVTGTLKKLDLINRLILISGITIPMDDLFSMIVVGFQSIT